MVDDGTDKAMVSVSRRIEAPAVEIFRILADPKRHRDLDGSGMLRGSVSQEVVSAVGDVFVTKMYYSEHGNYEMNNHVVEYEMNRRTAGSPKPGAAIPTSTPLTADGVSDGYSILFPMALMPPS